MGERNMVCTSQSVDMEIDQQGQDQFHPEPCFFLGNNGRYPQPSMYPLLSASGNTSNIGPRHFPSNYDSSLFYGSQFNGIQYHNPVTNMDLGASSSSFHNPCMIPPAGSRVFPLSQVSSDQIPSSSHNGILGVGINEFGVNHHFMDGVRNSAKRKTAEAVPGNYHQVNGSASSSSSSLGMLPLNTGLLQSEEQFESGSGVLDAAVSVPPEYIVNGVPPTTSGRSGRSVRSRSNTLGPQIETPMMHNTTHLVPGNFIGQSFQPNTWLDQQYGSTSNDGSSSSWNYNPPVPFLNGGSVSGVSSEGAIMGGQGYSDTMNSRNSTIIMNPPIHPRHHHFHPSPPAMQAMHMHNNYHLQPLIHSFRQPTSNTLHHGPMNHSLDDSEVGSRHPRPFPSNGLRIYRPHRSGGHQGISANNRPRLRFLSEDEVAILEFPGFYEVGSSTDRHRDMRLDIDDMSYEELLALGERIGNVVTGLQEETISSCLKTRDYTSSVSEDMNHEAPSCIICQVEYKNQEKIGTLDCGHEYHTDCIKRWLQVKNVCPICKVPGINVEDGRNTK